MPPFVNHLLVLVGVMLTAYGLVQMLFGYRLYRVWAVLQGIGAGAAAATCVSIWLLPDYSLLQYFAGLIGAGLGAILFCYVSVFLYGASLGLVVSLLIHVAWLLQRGLSNWPPSQAALVHDTWVWYLYGTVMIGSGALAVVFRRPFLIFLTSAGGAAMAALGASLAAPPPSGMSRNNLTFILVGAGITCVVLTIVGIVVQWKASDQPLDIFGGGGSASARKPKPRKPADDQE